MAVLLVVVFHAGLPVSGGFTGVDVFFAISGFVITAMLLADLTSVGRIRLRRFYARRVKRLAPALALMVVTIAALGTLAAPVGGQDVGARTGVFASLFAANAYLFQIPTGYFDPVATLNPFLHLWTLAVEEQFYVFFPTLLLLSWWLGRRSRFARASGRGVAIVAVSATTGVSFLLALYLSGSSNGRKQQFAFYGSPTRAWEFGAGALLALLVPWLVRMPRPVAHALGALGLAAIGTGAFAIQDIAGFQVMATLLPVLGSCAVLAAGSATRSGMARVLGVRPVVWIGDLSYSWYLWHWPLIVFAVALWPGAGWAAPTLAAVSLLPAWLSYRYLENPIRFSRRISGRAVLAIAAICIVLPIDACLGLLEASKLLAATPSMKTYQRVQTPHYSQFSCSTTPLACGRGVPKRRLVLTGDSDARQFGEPVPRAANRAGFEATLRIFPGCPFVDLLVVRRDLPLRRHQIVSCRRFYLQSLEAVVRMRPNLVIVAARTDEYLDNPVYGLGTPGGRITYASHEKEQLWSQRLASTLRQLNDSGIPVVVVHPVPEVQRVSISDCAAIRILTESCMYSAARSAVARYLQPSVDAENRAIAAAPGPVSAIDFRNQLCSRDRCASGRGSTVLYLDKYHLSVDGALTLTNKFYRAILTHARP